MRALQNETRTSESILNTIVTRLGGLVGWARSMSCKVLGLCLMDVCLSIFIMINLGEALTPDVIRMEWLIVVE